MTQERVEEGYDLPYMSGSFGGPGEELHQVVPVAGLPCLHIHTPHMLMGTLRHKTNITDLLKEYLTGR